MNYDTQKNKHSQVQYTFFSLEYFLQLDIILPIVNNNMVNFCPLYQLINNLVSYYMY